MVVTVVVAVKAKARGPEDKISCGWGSFLHNFHLANSLISPCISAITRSTILIYCLITTSLSVFIIMMFSSVTLLFAFFKHFILLLCDVWWFLCFVSVIFYLSDGRVKGKNYSTQLMRSRICMYSKFYVVFLRLGAICKPQVNVVAHKLAYVPVVVSFLNSDMIYS